MENSTNLFYFPRLWATPKKNGFFFLDWVFKIRGLLWEGTILGVLRAHKYTKGASLGNTAFDIGSSRKVV